MGYSPRMGHPLTDIELNNATILPLCHVASTARKDTGCRDDLDESTLNTPGLFNIYTVPRLRDAHRANDLLREIRDLYLTNRHVFRSRLTCKIVWNCTHTLRNCLLTT